MSDLNSILKIRMKKIFLSLLIGSFVFTFIGCDFTKDRAEMRVGKAIKIINEQCPRQLNAKMVYDSVGVEDGDVVFYHTLKDTTPYLLTLLRKNKGEYKEHFRKSWIDWADEDNTVFMEDIGNAGYGMVVRTASATTGRTVNVRFSPDEVADIAEAMSEAIAED